MDKLQLFRGNRLVTRNGGEVCYILRSHFHLFLTLCSMIRPITKNASHSLMERMINELLSNSRAWPFREPVNVEEVVDYLEFIKEPMGAC